MGRGAWTDAIQVLSCDRLGWQSERKSQYFSCLLLLQTIPTLTQIHGLLTED